MTFQLRVSPELQIRQIEDRDAAALFHMTERNRAHFRAWLPWVDHTKSIEDTRTFITGAIAQFQSNRGPNCAIWHGREIVGSLGCHPIDWANRSCSIGYCLDERHLGKGIVSQCCAALVDYLFREMKLHRVVIQCGTGNHRSCAIPKRLGFTCEGTLREAEWVNDRWVDLLVWSMLAQDWRAPKPA